MNNAADLPIITSCANALKSGSQQSTMKKMVRNGIRNDSRSSLRAGRFSGLKFRRQKPIAEYIVDFVCFEKKIVIELDGGQHSDPDAKEKDGRRDEWLQSRGFVVL